MSGQHNVTRKGYNVVSCDATMNCGTENMVYLTSCKKCGIQYVCIGETSQKMCSCFNNHRNRLKSMANLYLYNHFNADGNAEGDMCIMPIEFMTWTVDLQLPLRGWKEKIIGAENYAHTIHTD